MKNAEHLVLSIQVTANKVAHSLDPAGNGFHYQCTQITNKKSKSNSHFTKTLPSPKIHSCMNNRRTLSPKNVDQAGVGAFAPNFTIQKLNDPQC